MKLLSLCLALALASFGVRAAGDKPAEKPNRLERAGSSAAKSIERTGDRAAKATARGVDSAGNWVGRHADKAGKAMGRAADKTTDWVKKKTE
ncbi:MAG TPA: hypothetical protein VNH12_13270 [Burkholderiales bacterium]|nr:hypothetical protein [Burkholderiales bacterium]